MEKSEILIKLAAEYKRCFHVYVSMEKQATMFLEKGDMEAFQRMKSRAAHRSATLQGIKRAASALGIDENVLLREVNKGEGNLPTT